MEKKPRQTKQQYLRDLITSKQKWSEPLSESDRAKGFRGWHERGYLPHCDKPGFIQFVTFRLWDSLPASRRGEWEHLLKHTQSHAAGIGAQSIALRERENRRKLEAYLDRGFGRCCLRDHRIASFAEHAMLYDHGRRFRLLAWIVMPNHVHALIEVGDIPLVRIIQNWKSIIAVEANRMLGGSGRFWQPEYWDRYMRDSEQRQKAIRYIENNSVKAGLCKAPEDWLFSSARFRDPVSRELEITAGPPVSSRRISA